MAIVAHRTLAQVSESTNSINLLSARPEPTDVLCVRITDHADDTSTYTLSGTAPTQAELEGMAIFTSAALGQPWVKKGGLAHEIVVADADPVTNATSDTVTTLFPNYDYSTFE